MKFHWGTGLALALGTFVAIMIGFLVWGMQAGSKVAAEDRIYEKSLVYQEELDKKNNAAALATPAVVRVTGRGDSIQVQFPHQPVKAHLHLLRPNNPKQDQDFALTPDTLQYAHTLSRGILSRGRWAVKLYWQHGGKDYLHRQVLVLP